MFLPFVLIVTLFSVSFTAAVFLPFVYLVIANHYVTDRSFIRLLERTYSLSLVSFEPITNTSSPGGIFICV